MLAGFGGWTERFLKVDRGVFVRIVRGGIFSKRTAESRGDEDAESGTALVQGVHPPFLLVPAVARALA